MFSGSLSWWTAFELFARETNLKKKSSVMCKSTKKAHFWIINLKFSTEPTDMKLDCWKGQEKIRMQHKIIRKSRLLARAAYFLFTFPDSIEDFV